MQVCHVHNCERNHRTYKAFAKCVWPRAEEVVGEGRLATITRCGSGGYRSYVVVHLHSDPSRAQAALDLIDETGCGGRCSRNHELVELSK